jgi:hypothetical protein
VFLLLFEALNIEMEPQVSLDSERHLHRNSSIQVGDPGVTSSTPDRVEPRQPGMLCAFNIFLIFFVNLGAAGTYHDLGVVVLSVIVNIMLNAEKRPTRQWAAWTHQEEESFFNALRQVGKACYYWNVLWIKKISVLFYSLSNHLELSLQNFEKITRHVQSKNKDQVNCNKI